MFLYSILMLLTAVAMGIISIAIYRGKTDLIHDYHQTKVTDKKAYGRAFGKAMMVASAAPLISGIIGLFGENEKIAKISVCALFLGLAIGIALIIAVQKKHNRGIF